MRSFRISLWLPLAAGFLASVAPAVAATGFPSIESSKSDSLASDALIASVGGDDRSSALSCMAMAIGYEAGYEPVQGQQAVGEVILNRMRHPAYPKSVCGVVFQGSSRRTGCQFTFTCDGALRRQLDNRVLVGTRVMASRLLAGDFTPSVGGATHYHANYVAPYWASSLFRVGQIGAHIFYRAPGSLDMPARYPGGAEPQIAALGQWLGAIDPLTQGESYSRRSPPALLPELPTPPPAFSPWGIPVR